MNKKQTQLDSTNDEAKALDAGVSVKNTDPQPKVIVTPPDAKSTAGLQDLNNAHLALMQKIENHGDGMLLTIGEEESHARQLEKMDLLEVQHHTDGRFYASTTKQKNAK